MDRPVRLVVWGYANSWVVHRCEAGRITWASRWFSTRAQAAAEADRLAAAAGATEPTDLERAA